MPIASQTRNLIQFVNPRWTMRKRLESRPSSGIRDNFLMIPIRVRIIAAMMKINKGRSSLSKVKLVSLPSSLSSGGFQKYKTTATPAQTRGRAMREFK